MLDPKDGLVPEISLYEAPNGYRFGIFIGDEILPIYFRSNIGNKYIQTEIIISLIRFYKGELNG